MSYALFIDDERFPPADGRDWVIARTSNEALEVVDRNGWPDYVSFDHDLGGDDTSMAVIHGAIDRLLVTEAPLPFEWTVHSQNPIGRDNIAALLGSYERSYPAPAFRR